MSVVGVTRFSTTFHNNHPFQNKSDNFEGRIAHLFDETRLKRRFDIWEAVTLPSLAAQTDPDFSMLVVTSSLAPEWAQARLREVMATQPYKSAVVAPAPEEVFSRVVRRGVRALADPSHGRVGTFRLDDDDALAANWLARFREQGAAAASARPPKEVIGFEAGWYLMAAEGGVRLAAVERKLIACGLGRVSARAPLNTIHGSSTSHHRLDETLPTVRCTGAPAWIVTAHDLNDSDRIASKPLLRSPILSIAQAREALGMNFAALDLERITRALRPR